MPDTKPNHILGIADPDSIEVGNTPTLRVLTVSGRLWHLLAATPLTPATQPGLRGNPSCVTLVQSVVVCSHGTESGCVQPRHFAHHRGTAADHPEVAYIIHRHAIDLALQVVHRKHLSDFGPIDPGLKTIPYTRSYLHHLFKQNEPL